MEILKFIIKSNYLNKYTSHFCKAHLFNNNDYFTSEEKAGFLKDLLIAGYNCGYTDDKDRNEFIKNERLHIINSNNFENIQELVRELLPVLKMKINWRGKGINEKAYLNGKVIISIDKKYFRPTEVDSLLGDSRKARKELKWKPDYNIQSLAKDMVTQEIRNINDKK